MVSLGVAKVTIGAVLSPLGSALGIARGMVTKAMAAITGTISRAMGVMKRVAGIGGLGIAGSIGLAVREFAKFEEAMAKVSTMLRADMMPLLAGMKKDVRALSVEFGIATEKLATALFDVLSAGFDARQAMVLVREGARLATAGFADVDIAMRALLTTMKSYNVDIKRAADVSDMLYAIMAAGRFDLEQLASNMGQISGVAAKTGVSLAEVGAVTAGVVTASGEVSQSFTQVRSLLLAMAAPTKRQAIYIKELGFEMGSLRLAAEGMLAMIADLGTLTPEMMRRIVGSVEAMMAVQFVSTQLTKANMSDIQHGGGRVAEALVKAMGTTAFRLRRLGQQVKNVLVDVGEWTVRQWKRVSTDLGAVWEVMTERYRAALGRMAEATKTLGGWIREHVFPLWQTLLEGLVTIDIPFRKLVAIVRGGMKEIGTLTGWLLDTVKVLGRNVVAVLRTTLRTVLATIGAFGRPLALLMHDAMAKLQYGLAIALDEETGLITNVLIHAMDAAARSMQHIFLRLAGMTWPEMTPANLLVEELKNLTPKIKALWGNLAAELERIPLFPAESFMADVRQALRNLDLEGKAAIARLREVLAALPVGPAALALDKLIDAFKLAMKPGIGAAAAGAAGAAGLGRGAAFAPQPVTGYMRFGAMDVPARQLDELTKINRKLERQIRILQRAGMFKGDA